MPIACSSSSFSARNIEALKKLNVETVAIGTDDVEAAKALKNNKDGIKFPMPILADPKQELFKLYQAYDDFEGQPLHGTILIDGQGNVRFQRSFGRSVPRRRIHQDRGRAGEPDHRETMTSGRPGRGMRAVGQAAYSARGRTMDAKGSATFWLASKSRDRIRLLRFPDRSRDQRGL